MKSVVWPWIKGWSKLLTARRPEPLQQAERIAAMQLHIVMPVKAGLVALVLYYLFNFGKLSAEESLHQLVIQTLQKYFPVYIACSLVATAIFTRWRRFPPGMFQWLVFTLGVLDGLFIAGLVFITEGFDSMAYWMLPGMIVLNAISIPLAAPQIALNLLLSVFYLSAGILERENPAATLVLPPFRSPAAIHAEGHPGLTNPAVSMIETNRAGHRSATSLLNRLSYDTTPEDRPAETVFTRLFVLWLLTACCYGVQVLADRHHRMEDEAREFAFREGQLHSAGRLAAEIAHQLKNPLSIINNAIFSLGRTVNNSNPAVHPQIEMIQEEIQRADRILTNLMGYAQLNEGRVEKLDISEELNRAVAQVFPAGAGFEIAIDRDYAPDLPGMLMQRQHLSQIFVNILQNAREAMDGKGRISLTIAHGPDYSIQVAIGDTGPGVPVDRLGRIFEAYYSTKEKGTGLGLAIVKHNIELYGGVVRAESELGKGTRFILVFPGKAVISPAKKIQ